MQDLHGALQMQQGVRMMSKYLVAYNPEQKRELIKSFNKAGFIQFSEIEEGFLLSNNVDKSFLDKLSGISSVSSVSVIQRKESRPTLIPTGVSVGKLPWHILSQSDPYKPYLLAANNLTNLSLPELHIPVKSATSANYTIINKGEVIAELLLCTNNKEINLIKEELKVIGM
jgi:hypothetical protein